MTCSIVQDVRDLISNNKNMVNSSVLKRIINSVDREVDLNNPEVRNDIAQAITGVNDNYAKDIAKKHNVDIKQTENASHVVKAVLGVDYKTDSYPNALPVMDKYKRENPLPTNDNIGINNNIPHNAAAMQRALEASDSDKLTDISRFVAKRRYMDLNDEAEVLSDSNSVIGLVYSGRIGENMIGDVVDDGSFQFRNRDSKLHNNADRLIDDIYNVGYTLNKNSFSKSFMDFADKHIDSQSNELINSVEAKTLFRSFVNDPENYINHLRDINGFSKESSDALTEYFQSIKRNATLRAFRSMDRRILISRNRFNELKSKGALRDNDVRFNKGSDIGEIDLFKYADSDWMNKTSKRIVNRDPISNKLKSSVEERNIFSGDITFERIFDYMYLLETNPGVISDLNKTALKNQSIRKFADDAGITPSPLDVQQALDIANKRISLFNKIARNSFELIAKVFNPLRGRADNEKLLDGYVKLYHKKDQDFVRKELKEVFNKLVDLSPANENKGYNILRNKMAADFTGKDNNIAKSVIALLHAAKHYFPNKELKDLTPTEILEKLDSFLGESLVEMKTLLDELNKGVDIKRKSEIINKLANYYYLMKHSSNIMSKKDFENMLDTGSFNLVNGLRAYSISKYLGDSPQINRNYLDKLMAESKEVYDDIASFTKRVGEVVQQKASLEVSRNNRHNALAKEAREQLKKANDKTRSPIEAEQLANNKAARLEKDKFNKLDSGGDTEFGTIRARINKAMKALINSRDKPYSRVKVTLSSKEGGGEIRADVYLKQLYDDVTEKAKTNSNYRDMLDSLNEQMRIESVGSDINDRLVKVTRDRNNIIDQAKGIADEALRSDKDFSNALSNYDQVVKNIVDDIKLHVKAKYGTDKYTTQQILDAINMMVWRNNDKGWINSSSTKHFPHWIKGDIGYVDTTGVLADYVDHSRRAADLITEKYGALPRMMLFRKARVDSGKSGTDIEGNTIDQIDDVYIALTRSGRPIKINGKIMAFKDQDEVNYFLQDLKMAQVADAYYQQNSLMFAFRLNPNHATVNIKTGGIRSKNIPEADEVSILLKDDKELPEGITDFRSNRQSNLNKVNAITAMFEGKLKWNVTYLEGKGVTRITFKKTRGSLDIPKDMYVPKEKYGVAIGKSVRYGKYKRFTVFDSMNGVGDDVEALKSVYAIRAFNSARSLGNNTGKTYKGNISNMIKRNKSGRFATNVASIDDEAEVLSLNISSVEQQFIDSHAKNLVPVYVKASAPSTVPTYVYEYAGEEGQKLMRGEKAKPTKVIEKFMQVRGFDKPASMINPALGNPDSFRGGWIPKGASKQRARGANATGSDNVVPIRMHRTTFGKVTTKSGIEKQKTYAVGQLFGDLKDIAGLPFMRDIDVLAQSANNLRIRKGLRITINADGTVVMSPNGNPGSVFIEGRGELKNAPISLALLQKLKVRYRSDNQNPISTLPKIYRNQSEWTEPSFGDELDAKLKLTGIKIAHANVNKGNMYEIITPINRNLWDKTKVKGGGTVADVVSELEAKLDEMHMSNIQEALDNYQSHLNNLLEPYRKLYPKDSEGKLMRKYMDDKANNKSEISELVKTKRILDEIAKGNKYIINGDNRLNSIFNSQGALYYKQTTSESPLNRELDDIGEVDVDTERAYKGMSDEEAHQMSEQSNETIKNRNMMEELLGSEDGDTPQAFGESMATRAGDETGVDEGDQFTNLPSDPAQDNSVGGIASRKQDELNRLIKRFNDG